MVSGNDAARLPVDSLSQVKLAHPFITLRTADNPGLAIVLYQQPGKQVLNIKSAHHAMVTEIDAKMDG